MSKLGRVKKNEAYYKAQFLITAKNKAKKLAKKSK